MKDNPQNMLRQRLYKNFSNKQLLKPSSQLEDLNKTKKKQSIQKDFLVPKIINESHRKTNKANQTQINFKDGKIRLVDTQTMLKETKKQLIMLKGIQTSKLSTEGKALIQDHKTLQQKKDRLKKGEQRNLTPKNIFHFFETFPQMHLDFFYLNKKSHPYDYRIVPFNERNLNQYMTISCKGVTQFINKQAYFMTKQQWENEEKMYYKLQEIDFFKKYKINKNFRIWKNMMKRHYMKQMSNQLNQKLFLATNSTRGSILTIRKYCLMLQQQCKIIIFESRQTSSIQQFKNQMDKHQSNEFIRYIKKYEQFIVNQLEDCINKSLIQYKKQNNIFPEEDLKKNQGKKKQVLNYSQEALLRMQYIKIVKLIKLVQSILVQSKSNMIHYNLNNFIEVLKEINNEKKDEWFICKADWNGKDIIWHPDRNRIKEIFLELIDNSVKILNDQHIVLSEDSKFRKYKIQQEAKGDSKKQQKITLRSICLENQQYQRKNQYIVEELDIAFNSVQQEQSNIINYLKIYQKHKNNVDIESLVYSLTTAELRNIINQYKNQDIKMDTMPQKLERGLILVDFSELRQRIRNTPMTSLTNLLKLLPKVLTTKSDKLYSTIRDYTSQLNPYPNQVQKFVIFMKSIIKISMQLDDLTSQTRELIQLVTMMQQLKITNIQKYKIKVKETSNGITNLKSKIDESNANYDKNLNKFRKQLQLSANKIEIILNQLIQKYQQTPLNKKDSNIHSMIQFIDSISKLVEHIYLQAEKINFFQNQLNLKKTEFEKLIKFYKEFNLIKKLWEGRRDWKETVKNIKEFHFLEVSHQELKKKFDDALTLSKQLLIELSQNEVSKLFHDQIITFELVISTLIALHDPYLRQKEEWLQIPQFLFKFKNPELTYDISEIRQQDLPLFNRFDPKYTVNWIIKEQIYLYKEQLAYFGIKAKKEQQLQKVLNEVKQYLQNAELTLVNYKQNKDIYILGDNEKLFQEIDDKLLTLNNIMSSKYVQNLKNKVEILIKQFRYLQDLFDEMINHQKNWLELEPLLSTSAYSSKSLTKQSKQFNNCDNLWRRISKQIRDNASCKKLTDDLNNKQIFRTLNKNNTIFETIKKSLEQYLEKKRNYFPRFFFISNDQLLNILSQVKNLETLQPFLHKFFQNIQRFQFDKQLPIGVVNFDGEMLPFKQLTLRTGIQIEQILKNVQEQIKKSLSSLFKHNLPLVQDEEIQKCTLIQENSLQLISVIDWIIWTKLGEEYLAPEPVGDLYDWYQIQVNQISQLQGMLKNESITQNKRKKINSLIIQSIYLRDTTQNLYKKQVTSTNEYQWLKIIKFYSSHSNPQIYMKQINSKINYGFQFQALNQRLPITPQTQKYWFNISQIFQQKLLPCLVAKSSYGKTETIKQLSKLTGSNFMICQSSEKISLKLIQRILSGICATGTWFTFQDFTKLKIQYLSIISNQLHIIKKALLEGKDSFFFTKNVINLNPNFALFFTSQDSPINKIPQNLCNYLRVINITTPNILIIMQTLLKYKGLKDYKRISSLLLKYKNIGEQLFENRQFYNFNLKGLKQIIQRTKINQNDDQLKCIYQTIRKIMIPKLQSFDTQLFDTFTKQLFTNNFQKALQRKTTRQQLKINLSNLQVKIKEIKQNLNYKSGILLLGGSLQGKSTAINKTRNQINKNIKINHILHQSFTKSELFGHYEKNNFGLVPTIVKNSSTLQNQQWIVMDGKIQEYMQNFNSMIDQQKTLLLCTGEKLQVKNLKIFFETDKIKNLIPSFLNRVALIYFNNNLNSIETYFQQKILEIDKQYLTSDVKNMIASTILSTFKKLMGVKKTFLFNYNFNQIYIASCIVKNMIILLNQLKINFSEKDNKQTKKIIEKICIWSIFWGIESLLIYQTSNRFQKSLTQLFKVQNIPAGTLYNYNLSKNCEWMQWDLLLTVNQFTLAQQQYHEIIIETPENICKGYFIKMYHQNKIPFLLLGKKGSGKSTIINKFVKSHRNQNSISYLPVIIDIKNKSQQAQKLFENRLQSQRKSGKIILMPPPGKKLLIHIDDINLHHNNISNLELFRQMIEYQGLYDKKTYIWKIISDVLLSFSSTNIQVSNTRLLYRLKIMSLYQKKEQIVQIFNKIVANCLKKNNIKEDLIKIISACGLVQQTYDFYEYLNTTFKPKENIQFWKFTIKDISRLFQSFTRIKSQSFNKIEQLYKLWVNQLMRVFFDRLTNKSDFDILGNYLKKVLFINLKFDLPETFFKTPIIYTTYIDSEEYKIVNFENLRHTLEQKMVELSPKFNLILIKQIIYQISHLMRVISLQNGHFMLIGSRGIGKKSICQLGCAISNSIFCNNLLKASKTSNICINLIRAAQNNSTCLYLTEQQLKNEEMMFLINNFLENKTCDPKFNKEQLEYINNLFGELSQLKNQHLMTTFFQTVYKYLHIIVSVSLNDDVRDIIQKNPNILTDCTVNFIGRWPQESLYQVAVTNLQELKLDKLQHQKLSNIILKIHLSCQQLIQKYNLNVVYSPKKYIQLINLFNVKYQVIKQESEFKINKYNKSIKKIQQLNELITIQSNKLDELEKVLKLLSKEQESVLVLLETTQNQLSDAKSLLDEQNNINMYNGTDKGSQVNQTKQKKIKISNSFKNSDILANISRQQLLDLKKISNNDSVKIILEAIVLLFQQKIEWDAIIKKYLSDTSLISKLKIYQINNLKKEVLEKIKGKLKDIVNPSEINKFNAIKILYQWLKLLIQLGQQLIQLNDIKLKESGQNIENQQILQLEKKVAQYDEKYLKIKVNKQSTEFNIKNSRQKLKIAKDIYQNLKQEYFEWNIKYDHYCKQFSQIIYSVLLSCSAFQYFGPLSPLIRNILINNWYDILKQYNIQIHKSWSFGDNFFDDIQIESIKLYTNQYLTNYIILLKSPVVPYVLDPNKQVIKSLRQFYHDIKIIKFGQQNYAKNLEGCVKSGNLVLLEYNENKLDPSLIPLLNKKFIASGNRKIIKLFDNPIEYSESFKIILINTLENPKCDSQTYSLTNIIKFNVQKCHLKQLFEEDLLGVLFGQQKFKKTDAKNKITELNIQLKQIEQKLLNYAQEINLESTVQLQLSIDIVKLKNKKDILREQIQKYYKIWNSVRQKINFYEKLINKCVDIADILINELYKLNSIYTFSLKTFRNIFKEVFEIFTSKIQLISEKQIIIGIYNKVKQIIFKQDKIILQFIFKLTIENIPLESLSLLTNKINLKNSLEQKINDLKKYSQFIQLAQKLQDSTLKLEQIIINQNSLDLKILDFNFTMLETLALIKILYPTKFLQILSKQTQQYFNDELLQPKDHNSKLDKLISESNNKTPIMIISKNFDYIESLLILGREKKIPKQYISIIIPSIENEWLIEKYIENSTWIIIHNFQFTTDKIVFKIVETLKKMDNLKQQFRLILIPKISYSQHIPLDFADECNRLILQQQYKYEQKQFQKIRQHYKIEEMKNQAQKNLYSCIINFFSNWIKYQKIRKYNMKFEEIMIKMEQCITIINNLYQNNSFQEVKNCIEDNLTLATDHQEVLLLLNTYFCEDAINQNQCIEIIDQLKINQIESETNSFIQTIDKLMINVCIKRNPSSKIRNWLDELPCMLNLIQRQTNDPIILCIIKQCEKYNELIQLIKQQLFEIQSYLKKQRILTNQIKYNLYNLLNNKIPFNWKENYFLTIDRFDLWFEKLKKNHEFLQKYILKDEKYKITNIGAFYYPQKLLTSVLLKYSKKMRIKLEKLTFTYKICQNQNELISQNSINLSEIYLQYCKLDSQKNLLEELLPKQIYSKCPIIQLTPIETQKIVSNTNTIYSVPIYRNRTKNQFVISLEFPTKKRTEFWKINQAIGLLQV